MTPTQSQQPIPPAMTIKKRVHQLTRVAGVSTMGTAAKLTQVERTAMLGKVALAEGLQPARPGWTEARALHQMLAPLPSLTEGFPGDIISKSYLANMLKAPRLLIQLLTLFTPELLKPTAAPLRVLFLGASKHEVFDEGRWFHLAFWMMGIKRRLEITAVSPELGEDPEVVPPTAHAWVVETVEPAVIACAPMRLVDAVQIGAVNPHWEQAYDVAVMLHPGFIGHSPDWDPDAAWHDLAGFANIPLLGTSFDAADAMVDGLSLAVYGRPVMQSLWNPAAHFNPNGADDGFGTRLQWGGVLWSTQRRDDNADGGVSRFQEQAMEANRAFWAPYLKAMGALDNGLTWHRVVPMQQSDFGDTVWVADQIAIDVATGQVTAFECLQGATPLSRMVAATATCTGRLAHLLPLLDEIASGRRNEW